MNKIHLVANCLTSLFDADSNKAIKALKQAIDAGLELSPSLTRVAALCPGHNAMFYQQLYNLWLRQGKPDLKPQPAKQHVALVSDFTAEPLQKPLQLMGAARGVTIESSLPGFDSVEQVLLNPNSDVYNPQVQTIVLLMSEHWLDKHLGAASIVTRLDLENTKLLLASLVAAGIANGNSNILLCTFYPSAWPASSSYISTAQELGRKAAIDELNLELLNYCSDRVSICDISSALHIAGGALAVGRRSYLLAKIAFENIGIISVCRELASAISDISGQTHRACALDWDNTLWGGEIAEMDASEVLCGHNSPEANAFRLFQHQLKGLLNTGTLLAAVSRNSPSIATKIDANPDIPLGLKDFASVQINFVPKSESITAASAELGFGTEYILFIDDSTFELAEVLLSHPNIDILRAEKDPELTLQRFVEARLFNRVRLENADLSRHKDAHKLRQQREHKLSFKSNEDFLNSIDIKLSAEVLNEKNRSRVLQLINKSNQFNLSTRRHSGVDIDAIVSAGGDVLAFSYKDNFGEQGIISIVIVIPNESHYFIDTWLMSCRVLNRTVEYGIFEWLVQQYPNKEIATEYIANAKNSMIKNLLNNCSFELISAEQHISQWLYKRSNAVIPPNFIKHIKSGD
jgi:FkbH-like protein